MPWLALLYLSLAAPSPGRAQPSIFDNSVLHEVGLVLDPADWRALRENYRENDYYAANITLDGETVTQVGIRSRGAGSRNREKPGLKVDFNKYVPGQELRGYKSLVLDNLLQDPSLLRERMTFAVFEAMGMPAPQIAHGRLTVNGEYWGVYALIEPVSKPFLKSRVGEESGNLFDYEWAFPYYFEYLGPDPARYVPKPFEPETNEDHLAPGGLVSFIRTIDREPDETFIGRLGTFLDIERFLSYVAVENAVAEYDGFVGSYGMNNFYLYQYGGRDRFVLIPWDKDTSFHEESWPLWSGMEDNVLTRRLMQRPDWQKVYVDAVVRAVDEFVNASWLLPKMETAYYQVREAALLDKRKPYSNEEFEIAIDGLGNIIEARRGDVLRQAAGKE
jgi:spore coat protein CotH